MIAREHGLSNWAAFKAAVSKVVASRRCRPPIGSSAAVRAGDRDECASYVQASPGWRRAGLERTLPLVEACDRGALDIARLLLDAGADPRRGDPLLAAAHAGPHKRGPALDVVELLIERGAPDESSRTRRSVAWTIFGGSCPR